MQSQKNYRPDVDGLRAIAVMAVVLYHDRLGCTGGFVGVDIFFVISGYLITRILEKDLLSGNFSITKFYQRRIRRIFPALFLVLLVTCAAGLKYLPPDEFKALGKCVVAAAAFVSNILFYRQSGYFDNSSLTQPLLHTWTLSIEEQFYICWPWILALLQLPVFRRWKLLITLIIAGSSLWLSNFWISHNPQGAFYLLPSRAFELAIGALLSIRPIPAIMKGLPRQVAQAASLTGMSMILTAIFLYSDNTAFPGIAALLPVLGTAFIVGAGEGGPTFVGRILSFRPIVALGLISYSLYLWHWPISVFARLFAFGELSRSESVFCVLLSIMVSWLSWRFIERPFRDSSSIAGTSRAWVIGGLATTMVFVGLGLIVDFANGFPERSREVTAWVAWQTAEANVHLVQSRCMSWNDALPPETGCLLSATSVPANYNAVLWGDSNAAHLAPALDGLDSHLGIITREITKAGCPPLPGVRFVPPTRMTADCPAFNQNALRSILEDSAVRIVFLAARWNSLANGMMAAPLAGGSVSSSTSRQLFLDNLHRTVAAIIESHRRVILISQVPSPSLNPVTCLARARFNRWDETRCDTMPATSYLAEEQRIDSAILEATRGLESVQILHPMDVLCSSGACRLAQNGEPLYWDLSHLSVTGAKLLTPMLNESVKDLNVRAERRTTSSR